MYRKTYVGFILGSVFLALLPNTEFNLVPILLFQADPSLVAIFNALGILPALFLLERLSLKQPWGLREKLAHSGAFVLGAFALLWGLDRTQPFLKSSGISQGVYRVLIVGLVGLVAYGIVWGDVTGFITAWQNDLFVRIMSLDFIVLLGVWFQRKVTWLSKA